MGTCVRVRARLIMLRRKTNTSTNLSHYPGEILKGLWLGPMGVSITKAAEKFIEDLLILKPDFPSRGRILIGRFAKFKSIVEPIADGLKKCGLELG